MKKQHMKLSKPKDFLVLMVGIISVIYLLNFSFGFIEFLPDSLPLLGNIDEAVASYLLYSALRYFGIDLASIFTRNNN